MEKSLETEGLTSPSSLRLQGVKSTTVLGLAQILLCHLCVRLAAILAITLSGCAQADLDDLIGLDGKADLRGSYQGELRAWNPGDSVAGKAEQGTFATCRGHPGTGRV